MGLSLIFTKVLLFPDGSDIAVPGQLCESATPIKAANRDRVHELFLIDFLRFHPVQDFLQGCYFGAAVGGWGGTIGSDDLTLTKFIVVIFKLMMPSTFSLILVFFGLLHSWFNAWAELLRFPDRTFYLDWWASSEFGQYYRRWNIVVHEFLYYYVYLDA
jgi:hypothetical protein